MRYLFQVGIVPCSYAKTPSIEESAWVIKGFIKMVKKLGAIAFVEGIRPHRFRHNFGTTITRKGLDPLYGKELMESKSDKVYGRYT